MKLLTNNPAKRAGLVGFGLEIIDRIPLKISPNRYNLQYLETKAERLGHDSI